MTTKMMKSVWETEMSKVTIDPATAAIKAAVIIPQLFQRREEMIKAVCEMLRSLISTFGSRLPKDEIDSINKSIAELEAEL